MFVSMFFAAMCGNSRHFPFSKYTKKTITYCIIDDAHHAFAKTHHWKFENWIFFMMPATVVKKSLILFNGKQVFRAQQNLFTVYVSRFAKLPWQQQKIENKIEFVNHLWMCIRWRWTRNGWVRIHNHHLQCDKIIAWSGDVALRSEQSLAVLCVLEPTGGSDQTGCCE